MKHRYRDPRSSSWRRRCPAPRGCPPATRRGYRSCRWPYPTVRRGHPAPPAVHPGRFRRSPQGCASRTSSLPRAGVRVRPRMRSTRRGVRAPWRQPRRCPHIPAGPFHERVGEHGDGRLGNPAGLAHVVGALAGECRQRARVEGDAAAASEPLGHAPAGLPPSFHQREPQVRRLIVLDGRHRVVIRSHVHILPFPFRPAPAASLESRLPRIAPAHAR